MLKKLMLFLVALMLFFTADISAAENVAELPPVAAEVLKSKIKLEKYKQSLPPVARYILFDLKETERVQTVAFHGAERDEEPVRTESNWDELPEGPLAEFDITGFFLAYQPKDNIPEILSPRDGSLLPDHSNIHIRVKYDGPDPVFAEINSIASSSFLEVKNNELVILSSKLVRGREYHLRIRAGNAFSETVSFRVGSKYEDEIAKIIANTDIVAVGPRIPMEKIFPNGFFHSEEEADANMVTITVKVWRANTTEVEVDEEEVVDEIVRTIKVPVTKYTGGDTEVSEEILYNRSVVPEDEDTEEETDETGEDTEQTEEEIIPDDAEEEPEETAEEEEEIIHEETIEELADSAPVGEISETAEEETKENVDEEKGELVIEDYTEITTVEYVTRTVKRSVNKGELYSSTASFTCNRALAETFRQVFDELYEIKFPINDLGCYSWRNTAGGRISEHALGTAIDVNYMQNYCVYGDGSTVGDYWRPYEDIYSVTPEVVNIFRKYNFTWGGSWVTPQDYMHFSYFGT
ncbi:MAG: M15 family metallopeptidase [Firmicutes bacterium]|nr:M15 family metallopeptidase [Bacillota bacterium]